MQRSACRPARWAVELSVVAVLAACGASGSGGSDAGVDGVDAAEPEDRTVEFYATDAVQDIELVIAAADQQAMFDALPEQIYVPGTFKWNDVTIENVGVRFKGNSSSGPEQTHKRSFLIKFGELTDGQRFLGLRRVALDNAIQFGGLFSERMMDDILRSVGTTVSRSNYARLTINGEYMGVYVNVERVDKSFVQRYFDDGDGTLYKLDSVNAALEYVGDDPASYTETFEIKTNKSTADLTDAVKFVRELNTVPDEEFAQWFYTSFAGDEFLRLMPVMLLSGAFDQYTGAQPHNYYLYHEPSTGQWTYLPWDLDVGFSDDAWVPVIDGWNASYPIPTDSAWPLLRRIVADDELLAAYRGYAEATLEQYFHPDILKPRVDELHDQIRGDLVDDPFPHQRVVPPWCDDDFDDVASSIKTFIDVRYERAVAELASPVSASPVALDPWWPPACAAIPGPQPGDTSPVDPSDLSAEVVGAGSVTLSWIDNTSDESLFVVQRCSGAGCGTFLSIQSADADVVTAVDTIVEPGKQYSYRVFAMRPGIGFTGASNTATVTIE